MVTVIATTSRIHTEVMNKTHLKGDKLHYDEEWTDVGDWLIEEHLIEIRIVSEY